MEGGTPLAWGAAFSRVSFWYGQGFGETANMPMAAFQEYLERLPEHMAELKLLLAEVVVLPHMKARDRRDVLRDWQEAAGMKSEANTATPGILKMFGIGVKHVSRKSR